MTFIVDGTNGLTFPNSSVQASSGVVLQVVNATYSTQVTNATNTFTDSGLTATITPKFSTSKILVITSGIIYSSRAANNTGGSVQLVRGSTAIWTGTDNTFYVSATGATSLELISNYVVQYQDSPSTTSATTYKLQFRATASSSISINWNANTSVITLMEIAA